MPKALNTPYPQASVQGPFRFFWDWFAPDLSLQPASVAFVLVYCLSGYIYMSNSLNSSPPDLVSPGGPLVCQCVKVDRNSGLDQTKEPRSSSKQKSMLSWRLIDGGILMRECRMTFHRPQSRIKVR